MEAYVIKLNQGDYFQHRGGYDWGRTAHKNQATTFDTKEEAEEWIESRGLKSFGAKIKNAY